MLVVLFRHGHKEFAMDENPSLSPKGFEQAQNLAGLIVNGTLEKPTHCWYSEKKRTQQTLEKSFPGALTFERVELNHREGDEDQKKMRARIQKFLNDLAHRTQAREVHFICTHYDWIEEAMTLIDCDLDLTSYEFSSWAPGQFLVFDLEDGLFTFVKKGHL